MNEQELAWLDEGQPVLSKNNPNGWVPSDESIERMDQYIIDQINITVNESDTLYLLGDFCFGTRDSNRIGRWAQSYRDQIRCKNICLIWGNHDNRRIRSVFSSAYDRYELKWQGIKILLTHCAHAVWEGSHYGAWHLYGHSHTTAEPSLDLFSSKFFHNLTQCATTDDLQNLVNQLELGRSLSELPDFVPRRLSLDVGIDNAYRVFGEYRPLSLQEISVFFHGRLGSSADNGKS